LSEQKTRTFIAVHFPEAIISSLERLQQRLSRAAGERARIKWVAPANIHLTLQFLGDVDDERLARLPRVLAPVVAQHPVFQVEIVGTGTFPSPARPRVVWAGCREGASQLAGLAAAVCQATSTLGFEPERRPFRAHLTLGRIKDSRKTGKLSGELEKNRDIVVGICRIDVVSIMSSRLRPQGPVYTTLDRLPLGG